jgi:hypothetical protein
MRRTKKMNTWHFGIKVHGGQIGAAWCTAADDACGGCGHRGEKREVFGDQADWKEADRQRLEINQSRSRTRAHGEHAAPRIKAGERISSRCSIT